MKKAHLRISFCHLLMNLKKQIPLKTPKIKILKHEKLCWRYNHFTHVHQKSQSYDVRFLRYRQKILSFWVIFCHFIPPSLLLMILNIKILKKMKKMSGYIILLYIHMYHKWRSYDICFLKYRVPQTEILNILGQFCPFSHWQPRKSKF